VPRFFSSRLSWDARPNALTRMVEDKRRSGAAVVDLTESNPTRAGLVYDGDSILAALGDPRSLVYEPAPAGLTRARAAVAAYYAAQGHPVSPDHIVLTASTSEAYAWLFKLLADPGDEILVPRPSYPLFEFLAGLESVRLRHYPLAYHERWWIDRKAFEAAVTGRTRAVVIVNPNNPTGSFLKRDELEWLGPLCGARGLAILSDEVFADYSFAADERRVPTLAGFEGALVFSLGGLSKMAGLPQMKLGWIVAGGSLNARAGAVARLEWIADTYLSAGAPVQNAAARLFELRAGFQEQMRRRLRGNLDLLRAALQPSSPCRLLEPEGGWYATLQLPRTRGEEEWVLGLLEHTNVLVQPGYFYDFSSEPFVVLSLLTPEETFREGVRRLLAYAPG